MSTRASENSQAERQKNKIGRMIRAKRLQLNMSQTELADQIGAHEQTIHKIESGIIKYSRYFDQIGRILSLDLIDKWSHDNANGSVAPSSVRRLGDLPVHGAMPYERDHRMILLTPVAASATARLQCLQNVTGAYAFPIVNNLMAPAYEIGDEVQVNPLLPPEPGRDLVFYSKPKTAGGEQGVCVARVVAVTAKSWSVMHWSNATGTWKPQEFTLPRSEFKKAHVIVGQRKRWNS